MAKISPAVVVIKGVMKVPGATKQRTDEDRAPGAALVGHGASERLGQAPPELAKGKRQADAADVQTGDRVERAQKQAHGLACAHGQK